MTLAQAAKGLLLKESISAPPAHQERAKTLLPLLSLVKSRVEGTRLSIAFGDDDKQIAFMRDFLPAITQKWRNNNYREQRMNRFKQINLGMLNYESAMKSYPAHATYDAEGRPVFNGVEDVRDTGFDIASLLFKAIAEYSGMIDPKPEAKKNALQNSNETNAE